MSNGYMRDKSGLFKATAQGNANEFAPVKPRSGGGGSGGDDGFLKNAAKAVIDLLNRGVSVIFPPHLYIPEYAQSLDFKNLYDVDPGDRVVLIDFTAPQGAITVIQYYGIFNDGLLATDYDFYPTVNGRRCYIYHGDPLDKNRIYLGVAPDLANESLVVGTLYLQPGDRLMWEAENRSAVTTTMGARVVGYVDRSQTRKQTRTQG